MNLSKTIVLEIRNEYTKRILFSIVPIMKEREFAHESACYLCKESAPH